MHCIRALKIKLETPNNNCPYLEKRQFDGRAENSAIECALSHAHIQTYVCPQSQWYWKKSRSLSSWVSLLHLTGNSVLCRIDFQCSKHGNDSAHIRLFMLLWNVDITNYFDPCNECERSVCCILPTWSVGKTVGWCARHSF